MVKMVVVAVSSCSGSNLGNLGGSEGIQSYIVCFVVFGFVFCFCLSARNILFTSLYTKYNVM